MIGSVVSLAVNKRDHAMPRLDFWYEFASTYSYVAAMRIEPIAEKAGIDVRWRPFLLGPIFATQDWNTSPFNIYPRKGRYMVRDMERLTRDAGLPFSLPDPFPMNGLHAARTALVGVGEGFVADFTKATYRAEFGEGRDISDIAVLGDIVNRLDLDAAAILERAGSPEIKDELKRQVAEAQEIGIFGAPTFVCADGEMFWGNDRMEEAFAWAALHRQPTMTAGR